eukprot:c6770_g1_i1.p1 GENE.c6770_g1_i1~~c6770_g1_i1.p1  ORF type:complete len:623 (+),score=106.28 c6770_g1_i1:185-2053(+)
MYLYRSVPPDVIDSIHLSTLLATLARLQATGGKSVIAMRYLTESELKPVIERLCTIMSESPSTLNDQAFVTTLCSVSKLTPPISPTTTPFSTFFDRASHVIVQRASSLSAQGLALSAWAFARAAVWSNVVFATTLNTLINPVVSDRSDSKKEKHSSRAESRFKSFNSQNLANTAWAFAKFFTARPAVPELPKRVPKPLQAATNPDQTEPPAVTGAPTTPPLPPYTLRPLTIAKKTRVFSELAVACTLRAPKLSHQALATITWAFAASNEPAPNMFARFSPLVIEGLKDMPPQSFALVLWAFARAEIRARKLFAAAADQIQANPSRLESFSNRDVSNVVFALTRAEPDIASGPVLSILITEVEKRLGQLAAEELVTVLWSLSRVTGVNKRLFIDASPVVRMRAKELTGMGLARMAALYVRVGPEALDSSEYEALYRTLVHIAPTKNANVIDTTHFLCSLIAASRRVRLNFGDGAILDQGQLFIQTPTKHLSAPIGSTSRFDTKASSLKSLGHKQGKKSEAHQVPSALLYLISSVNHLASNIDQLSIPLLASLARHVGSLIPSKSAESAHVFGSEIEKLCLARDGLFRAIAHKCSEQSELPAEDRQLITKSFRIAGFAVPFQKA